uniref:Uncharacterized protein n=2 Tax=Oryza TaxID=4527 RepID=Q6Z593_ORYSJ|nr:hypothetical protein [Oryza sativa Japonica Group]
MDPLSPALARPTWSSSSGKPPLQEDNCLERSSSQASTPPSWRYRRRRLDHVARVPAMGHLVASPSPPSSHHDSLAAAAHHPCRACTTAPSAPTFHGPCQSSTATSLHRRPPEPPGTPLITTVPAYYHHPLLPVGSSPSPPPSPLASHRRRRGCAPTVDVVVIAPFYLQTSPPPPPRCRVSLPPARGLAPRATLGEAALTPRTSAASTPPRPDTVVSRGSGRKAAGFGPSHHLHVHTATEAHVATSTQPRHRHHRIWTGGCRIWPAAPPRRRGVSRTVGVVGVNYAT